MGAAPRTALGGHHGVASRDAAVDADRASLRRTARRRRARARPTRAQTRAMLASVAPARASRVAIVARVDARRRRCAAPRGRIVAAKRDDDADGASSAPKGFPLKGSSSPGGSRGPGAAPLRMETTEQRKFGYGGDGQPPRDDDDDEEAWDDGWNPGDEGQPSAWGLVILLVIGSWALWEYKRPGGSLNPETKRRKQRARYERAFKAKYGYLPGERPPSTGATGSISGLD